MDPELRQAACLGDIEFLKRALATKSIDYFLSYYSSPDPDGFPHSEMMGNILHLSARKDKLNFMREAMKLLPNHVVLRLLSQQDECDQNPLHVAAAQKACFEPVGLILGFYKSLSEDDDNHDKGIEKPWLALNEHNRTPLHVVLSGVKNTEDNEECALEILSMDSLESFCNTVDSQGNSPLFYAVKNRFSRVSEEILKSSSSYSVSGEDGFTPLHFAPNSSENVLRLLLEKHPDMVDKVEDKKGFYVPHQWAVLNERWPFNFLKKGGFPGASSKIFIDLIKSKESMFWDSPLHTAARMTANVEIGRALVQGYQREIEARNQSTEIVFPNFPPWNLKNKFGETPFIVSIASKNEELALYFLSIDKTLCQIHTRSGRSPLLYAVCFCNSYGQVVEEILSIQEPEFGDLRAMDGTTVLHPVGNCPEEIGTMVLEKYWWMMNLVDDKGKTALDYAKQAQESWLVRLLRNPSLIQKQPFDWVTACQQNETWAVVAFVDTCQDLHKVCREKQDTPLHHITFQTYQECLQFLKKDSIADLKNTTDSEGATPLHRALERKDMYLAKALLADDGVKRNIADHNGITAMDLLTKLCQEDDYWETINPDLKTLYIVQSRTNLDRMRTTLSVVAALLATITFAAGFTLPGGLNSQTGSAMLAKKASFIVFLLADAYAMCTSMLVLFCLIWSMVCDEDMSYVLVDRCVFILMQSLYGSLVAFMTGIYTVINQSKLWVGIVIFIMCSLLGIAANRTVLYTILSKLIPASNRDYKKLPSLQKQTTMPKFGIDKYGSRRHQNVQDQTDDDHDPPLLLLEEGKTSTFGIDMMSHSSEGTSSSHQNHDQEEDEYRLALLEQNGKGTISHQNQDQKEDCLALLEEGKASTSGHDI